MSKDKLEDRVEDLAHNLIKERLCSKALSEENTRLQEEIAKLKAEANRQGADYTRLYLEAGRLREEIAKWKSEYENVCKFATDYEQQRDRLRKMVDVARRALRFYDNEKNWFDAATGESPGDVPGAIVKCNHPLDPDEYDLKSDCGEVASKALVELDRLEKESL